MIATARQTWALSLVAALLLNFATPVLASEGSGESPAPSGDSATAVATIPMTSLALAPSLFSGARQTRPIDFGIPQNEHTGFGAPGLRRSLYATYGALQVLDFMSTRKALASGASEANPAMAGVAKNSSALLAVKAGSAVATTFFAEKLAKKHPRRATILMAVMNTAYVAIVAHNYRVAKNSR